ncbi:anthranilate phosphoribosyltransferase [bacterium]|nr:anthranilate phosphoribosyltransferase [bacterium]
MIKESIALLVEGQDLSRAMAQAAMDDIMSGRASEVQISAFLVAMRMKGESPAELAGCAESMRTAMQRVSPRRRDLVDTCGTGGDGGHTFNISTAVAFVAAGMGLGVAKHGNRSVSSRCGSADVLEALGVRIDLNPEEMASCIDEAGIGFLFAPTLHTSTRHAMPVRRELGLRTIFNLLGPLTNPAGVSRQLIGTYSVDVARKLAYSAGLLNPEHVWVVSSEDGLDELSPCGVTHVFEVRGDRITEFDVHPQDAGLRPISHASLSGGDAQYNAALIEDILLGQGGERSEAVVLNAAAVGLIAGLAPDLRTGAGLAREALASGKAYEALRQLRVLSQRRMQEVVQ